ncbi:MAG: DUF222 domain-containing protein [Acidimicrobiia bacterium]
MFYEFESVHEGLDEMDPGAALGAVLSEIDVDDLSGSDLIVVLKAARRMASHYEALVFQVMAALWDFMNALDDDPEFAPLASSAELRTALRLTRRAADNALGLALELCERLPRVWEALSDGDIDISRVWVIVRGTEHLPEDTAREVVEQIIEDAPLLTTGELWGRIRRLCVEADPEEAEARYEEAVKGRRVVAEPTPSSTANLLGLDLPPDGVAQTSKRIHHLPGLTARQDSSRHVVSGNSRHPDRSGDAGRFGGAAGGAGRLRAGHF